jgi:hypothetical protein
MSERLSRRLVDAADRNDAHAVRLLLSAGWPVDARGKHGATALHFAAWHGNAHLVKEILPHGAAVEIRDRDFSMTPVRWAFHGSRYGSSRDRGNYAETVDAFLAVGADVPSGDPGAVDASESVRDVLRRWKKQQGGSFRG